MKGAAVQNSNDDMWTWFAGIIAAVVIGPTLLASAVPTAQAWLVRVHVLATEGVLIPVGTGAGLDLARIAIAAGALLLVALIVVLLVRGRVRAAQDKRSRA